MAEKKAEKKLDPVKLFGKELLADYDLGERTARDVVTERLLNSKALLDNPKHTVKNKKGGKDNPTTPRACWKLKGKKYQVWAVYGKKRLEIVDGKTCVNATSPDQVHAHLDKLIELTADGHFDEQLERLKQEEKKKLEYARSKR